jgi:hypothetical protein
VARGNEFEVSVRGYRELIRALKTLEPDERRQVRAAFREVGESVRVKAAELFQKYSSVSAAGYKVRVRQRGIAVEQSIRKTTGTRPDYGALQMRQALLPARADTYAHTQAEFEKALDKVVEHFNL